MFRFRLQRILDYRRQRVEHLEHETLQRQHALQQEEGRLAALYAESQRQQGLLAALARLRGDELQQWQRYYRLLEHRLGQQHLVVQGAQHALRAKQQELIVARQEQQMLETMADKAHQRYRQMLARHEQQLLDDLAITRARYEH